jgi:hypothetical protein
MSPHAIGTSWERGSARSSLPRVLQRATGTYLLTIGSLRAMTETNGHSIE